MDRGSLRRGVGWAGKGIASSALLLLLIAVVGAPRANQVMDLSGVTRPIFGILGPLAGGAMVVAGIAAWWTVRPRTIGPTAIVAGFAWFAPGIVDERTASDLVRSVALLGGPLLLPAAAVLLTGAWAATGGRVPARVRWPVRAVIVVTLALTALLVVTYDRALDPLCGFSCTLRNELALVSGADAASVHRLAWTAWSALSVIAWAMVAVACAWGVRARTAGTARAGGAGRADLVMLVAGVALGASGSVASAVTWLRSVEPPLHASLPVLAVAWVVAGLALMALAAGVGRLAVAGARRAIAIRAALDTLSAMPGPGGLRAGLAAALDDPDVAVRYQLDDGRWVDGNGMPDPPRQPVPGRAVTTIERGGRTLATVEHVAVDDPSLARGIGAAARLAVDNERLRASILAGVADLQASQVRIVAAADAERRRLERDLHDGAQQRLLALTFEIRVGLARARAAGDGEVVALLERAEGLARDAITQLRRLAHGIHPAILADTGLAPALASLADDAPIPLELDVRSPGRCPEPVELAAYHLVADALERASRAGATHLAVQVDRAGGRLRVSVADDAPAGAAGGPRVADRVGAIGGRLVREGVAVDGGGQRLVAELPCA